MQALLRERAPEGRPMRRRETKASFLARCQAMGITIDLGRHAHGTDVMAFAPRGHLFEAHGTHSVSLWTVGTPDWSTISRDLGDAPLTDCDSPTCDYCAPEE